MNLIVNCIIDNLVNNSSTSFDWVIHKVRYRKTINTQTLLNYWYKKESKKHLYLRNIKDLKYELQKCEN